MELNNLLLVTGLSLIIISQNGPKVVAEVKQILAKLSKPKHSAIDEALSEIRMNLASIMDSVNRQHYEFDSIKALVQSLQNEVGQVKQDNNIAVSALGSMDAKLSSVEKSAVASTNAITRMANTVAKLVDLLSGTKQARKAQEEGTEHVVSE